MQVLENRIDAIGCIIFLLLMRFPVGDPPPPTAISQGGVEERCGLRLHRGLLVVVPKGC